MRTLKNTLTIAAFFSIAISFAAGAQQKQVKEGTKTYITVEKKPEFPGGDKAWSAYLAKNVKYPSVDRNNNIQGKVYVSFVVEPDGKLTDVSAIRGPSETLKAEAVRVISNSPKWKPGAQNGKYVRVQYTVPINFTLGSKVGSLNKGVPPRPKPPVAKNQKEGNVFVSVEKSPEFPGGGKAFTTYLEKNVRYPAVDRENNIQGQVYVSFVVEPDGQLSDVTAVRGPSETLKAEGVRVIANSPAWKSGLQDGKPVRVHYTVPINFALSDK